MALETAGVERLIEWFTARSTVRFQYTEIPHLVEQLAVLAFAGDRRWPDHPERADTYRAELSHWLSEHDSGLESEFATLTAPGADPGAFINWLTRLIAHRTTIPAGDDDHLPDHRHDRRNGIYEWYDPATGSWRSRTWTGSHTADGPWTIPPPAGTRTGGRPTAPAPAEPADTPTR
ncbi:hypothetical protein AB0D08_22425 [Kitasatospora sp. NPDC048540]|uniref:hypothetical protein n=1 Tax=unclassified Kitasatospora TaxID=2633591 RepID=UPI000539BC70|nr:hypothetical protein [Kitasatospora sp. MBT63]